jgi:hypothetical protein
MKLLPPYLKYGVFLGGLKMSNVDEFVREYNKLVNKYQCTVLGVDADGKNIIIATLKDFNAKYRAVKKNESYRGAENLIFAEVKEDKR